MEECLLNTTELEVAISKAVGYSVSMKAIPDDDRAIMEAQLLKAVPIIRADYAEEIKKELESNGRSCLWQTKDDMRVGVAFEPDKWQAFWERRRNVQIVKVELRNKLDA